MEEKIVTSLPRRFQTETLEGYKLATLATADGVSFFFYGIGYAIAYGVVDVARCTRLPYKGNCAHDSPPTEPVSHGVSARRDYCTCGFYIMYKDEQQICTLMREYGSKMHVFPARLIRLEVEAWGTIILHERGFRASNQRVLGVFLPPTCRFQSLQLQHFETSQKVCSKHLVPVVGSFALPDKTSAFVDVVCESHVNNTFISYYGIQNIIYTPVTLGELSNRLGTEVGWDTVVPNT